MGHRAWVMVHPDSNPRHWLQLSSDVIARADQEAFAEIPDPALGSRFG
jgi:hypothetical protein